MFTIIQLSNIKKINKNVTNEFDKNISWRKLIFDYNDLTASGLSNEIVAQRKYVIDFLINLDFKITRSWNAQVWKSYWFKSFKYFNVQIIKDTALWARVHVSYDLGTFILNLNLLGYEFDLYI